MNEHLHDKEEEKEKMMKEIEKLKNELKSTNERNEKLRKFNKISEKIDEQLMAQRRTKETNGLGYSSIGPMKIGESSKPKRMKDDKMNNSGMKSMNISKSSCNHCGKLGHKSNISINQPVS